MKYRLGFQRVFFIKKLLMRANVFLISVFIYVRIDIGENYPIKLCNPNRR